MEIKDNFDWSIYDWEHSLCPACGSKNFISTLAARWGDKDTNTCRCQCGWVGIRDETVAPKRLKNIRHSKISQEKLENLNIQDMEPSIIFLRK